MKYSVLNDLLLRFLEIVINSDEMDMYMLKMIAANSVLLTKKIMPDTLTLAIKKNKTEARKLFAIIAMAEEKIANTESVTNITFSIDMLVNNSSILQMSFFLRPFFFDFYKQLQFNLFIKQGFHILNRSIFYLFYHASIFA